MKHFAYSLAIVMVLAVVGLFPATSAVAGINVNESGNSVLCKGEKSCSWLKPACKKEGGTYTKGAGGTGKCDFPSVGKIGFTATPKGDQPAAKKIQK